MPVTHLQSTPHALERKHVGRWPVKLVSTSSITAGAVLANVLAKHSRFLGRPPVNKQRCWLLLGAAD